MYRFVSCRFVYYTCLFYSFRFVSFSSRIVSFRFDYTKTIENDWNNKTKRNETFELILIDKSVGPQESGSLSVRGRGWGAGGRAAGGLARPMQTFRFEIQIKFKLTHIKRELTKLARIGPQ